MLENVFCGKVVLLGIKKIHGLHDGLKSLETKINRGRYRVPKFANEFVRTRKNGINTNFFGWAQIPKNREYATKLGQYQS